MFLFSARKDSTKLEMSTKGHLLNGNVGVFFIIFFLILPVFKIMAHLDLNYQIGWSQQETE